ncbi:LysR family transcriptional regulator [Roseovarius faecimaris]|uniref:LysR family transcriptional regulator n=1 Tax=Roseovarius faecimaris TaxID=2494550 RepID=A0A6I6IQM3_9RHOB|nr:LysR substrate-binding domain-containing protein [Roseovarius faecimaris]QGX98153.1 LysR family transcriptional regulator [Roseovarius faecimaris]
MNVTFRQLTYFKALAEQRHFGRAAEVVNVSQPALSVQIREMEAALGQPLVERRAREAVLTPFGRMILHHAERVLAEMQALNEAARWRGGLSGRLNLGLIPTVAPYILTDVLEALRTGDISLDVQVQEAKTDRLIRALQSGQLDAAVMALPVVGEGLIAVPLFEDPFLLAGSAARLEALGEQSEALRPTGLGAAPLLLLEDGHCLTDQALEVCGRNRSHAQIDTGASSLPTLARLVAAGFGLTLIPELAAVAELRAAPDMRVIRFAAPEPSRQIGLVRRTSSQGEEWFAELSSILARVGERLLNAARLELAKKKEPAPKTGTGRNTR